MRKQEHTCCQACQKAGCVKHAHLARHSYWIVCKSAAGLMPTGGRMFVPAFTMAWLTALLRR